MTEKTLRTRIALLYKTYAEWQAEASFIPLKGEVCICEVPPSTGSVVDEPAVLIKIGDGVKTWANLDWTSGKAADVYAWAKKASLDWLDLDSNFKAKLEEFVDQHSTSIDTQYQIVSNGKDKWKLQKSTDGETWVDATGTIDVSGKVDKVIESEAGRALIFNESDGGGAKFEANDGTASFVGVNSDTNNGIGAQLYDIDVATSKGSKLDVTKNGIYYTVGDTSAQSASLRDVEANELVTRKDIAGLIGVLHFRGVFNSLEEVDNPKHGDVAIVGAKEYVYVVQGSLAEWRELGDEGIYETKAEAEAAHQALTAAITAEETRAESAELALDERISSLEMPKAPEYDSELGVLFINGNSVRIIDNGTANVAEWFGEESAVQAPNTLEFPYNASISCGGNGMDKPVEFIGSELIMDSGKIKTIRGGGLGACKVGNVDIIVNGGDITAVTGGGQKKTKNLKGQNTVDNVHITINGGTWSGQRILCAGGTDAVNVGHAVIDMNAGNVEWCYACGSNGGFINDSKLNLKGGTITNLLGATRGYISDATINVIGAQITNMWAGADDDPVDDGEIKNIVINAFEGSITTLRKGFSKRSADFNCTGEYNANVIGNESVAIEECNLTEKILILNCNL